MDRLLALAGIIPPFVILWIAEGLERRVREPTTGWRYRVFAAAGLMPIPVAWAGRWLAPQTPLDDAAKAILFESFVLAACVEEFAKALSVFLLTRGALGPRTRYGAFLYCVHAAMGFALVENVLAMLRAPDIVTFSTRFFLRAYMPVPMHLVAGAVLGYGWALRRFDRGPIGLAGGLGVAILIHGTFNALLLSIDALPARHETLRIICAVLAMAIPVGGTAIVYLLAKRLRRRDEADTEASGRRRSDRP